MKINRSPNAALGYTTLVAMVYLVWLLLGQAGMACASYSIVATTVLSDLPGPGSHAAEVSDMDEDGDLDIVVSIPSDGHVILLINDGSNTFTSQYNVTTNMTGAGAMVVADLDGNNSTDIAVCSRDLGRIIWFQREAQGMYEFHWRVLAKDASGAIQIEGTDFDGDGDVDLVAVLETADTIALYENDGNGVFAKHVASNGLDGPRDAYPVDFDEDNDTDILVASTADSEIVLLKNQGDDITFAAVHLVTMFSPRRVRPADVNGDGAQDFVAVSLSGDSVILYANNNNGSYVDIPVSDGVQNGPQALEVLANDEDFVVASTDGALILYDANGTHFVQKYVSDDAGNIREMTLVDFDSDGDQDIIALDGSTGQIQWFELDIVTTTAPTVAPSTSPTAAPTVSPAPSAGPTNTPSVSPTVSPMPTMAPSTVPTEVPTLSPTRAPTSAPSLDTSLGFEFELVPDAGPPRTNTTATGFAAATHSSLVGSVVAIAVSSPATVESVNGSVAIFTQSSTSEYTVGEASTWEREYVWEPPAEARAAGTDGGFGFALTIVRDSVITGAPEALANATNPSSTGRVFVFSISLGQQTDSLLPSLPYTSITKFGFSLGSGTLESSPVADVVAVGAPGGNPEVVQVFSKRGSSPWKYRTALLPSDGESGDNFSYAISARLNTSNGVAVGAPRHNNGQGAVYLFTTVLQDVQDQVEGTNYTETQKLEPSSAVLALSSAPRFGAAVAFAPNARLLVVGAPGTADASANGNGEETNAGGVCLYIPERNNDDDDTDVVWTLVAVLTSNETTPLVNDMFGAAVAVGYLGKHVLVGAPGRSFTRSTPLTSPSAAVHARRINNVTTERGGAVHVFELNVSNPSVAGSADDWVRTAIIRPRDSQVGDAFGHAVDSNPAAMFATAPFSGSFAEGEAFAFDTSCGGASKCNCAEGNGLRFVRSVVAGANSTAYCSACRPGTYASADGCVACPRGSAQDAWGAWTCESCTEGTFASSLGQIICTNCSAGTNQSATGQHNCSACPVGTVQGLPGQPWCSQCAPGTSQPQEGQTECGLCAEGEAQSATGQAHCVACSPGTFQAGTGAASCELCPAGQKQGSNGSTTCSECTLNKYSDAGAAVCSSCPSGKVSSKGTAGIDGCTRHSLTASFTASFVALALLFAVMVAFMCTARVRESADLERVGRFNDVMTAVYALRLQLGRLENLTLVGKERESVRRKRAEAIAYARMSESERCRHRWKRRIRHWSNVVAGVVLVLAFATLIYLSMLLRLITDGFLVLRSARVVTDVAQLEKLLESAREVLDIAHLGGFLYVPQQLLLALYQLDIGDFVLSTVQVTCDGSKAITILLIDVFAVLLICNLIELHAFELAFSVLRSTTLHYGGLKWQQHGMLNKLSVFGYAAGAFLIKAAARFLVQTIASFVTIHWFHGSTVCDIQSATGNLDSTLATMGNVIALVIVVPAAQFLLTTAAPGLTPNPRLFRGVQPVDQLFRPAILDKIAKCSPFRGLFHLIRVRCTKAFRATLGLQYDLTLGPRLAVIRPHQNKAVARGAALLHAAVRGCRDMELQWRLTMRHLSHRRSTRTAAAAATSGEPVRDMATWKDQSVRFAPHFPKKADLIAPAIPQALLEVDENDDDDDGRGSGDHGGEEEQQQPQEGDNKCTLQQKVASDPEKAAASGAALAAATTGVRVDQPQSRGPRAVRRALQPDEHGRLFEDSACWWIQREPESDGLVDALASAGVEASAGGSCACCFGPRCCAPVEVSPSSPHNPRRTSHVNSAQRRPSLGDRVQSWRGRESTAGVTMFEMFNMHPARSQFGPYTSDVMETMYAAGRITDNTQVRASFWPLFVSWGAVRHLVNTQSLADCNAVRLRPSTPVEHPPHLAAVRMQNLRFERNDLHELHVEQAKARARELSFSHRVRSFGTRLSAQMAGAGAKTRRSEDMLSADSSSATYPPHEIQTSAHAVIPQEEHLPAERMQRPLPLITEVQTAPRGLNADRRLSAATMPSPFAAQSPNTRGLDLGPQTFGASADSGDDVGFEGVVVEDLTHRHAAAQVQHDPRKQFGTTRIAYQEDDGNYVWSEIPSTVELLLSIVRVHTLAHCAHVAWSWGVGMKEKMMALLALTVGAYNDSLCAALKLPWRMAAFCDVATVDVTANADQEDIILRQLDRREVISTSATAHSLIYQLIPGLTIAAKFAERANESPLATLTHTYEAAQTLDLGPMMVSFWDSVRDSLDNVPDTGEAVERAALWLMHLLEGIEEFVVRSRLLSWALGMVDFAFLVIVVTSASVNSLLAFSVFAMLRAVLQACAIIVQIREKQSRESRKNARSGQQSSRSFAHGTEAGSVDDRTPHMTAEDESKGTEIRAGEDAEAALPCGPTRATATEMDEEKAWQGSMVGTWVGTFCALAAGMIAIVAGGQMCFDGCTQQDDFTLLLVLIPASCAMLVVCSALAWLAHTRTENRYFYVRLQLNVQVVALCLSMTTATVLCGHFVQMSRLASSGLRFALFTSVAVWVFSIFWFILVSQHLLDHGHRQGTPDRVRVAFVLYEKLAGDDFARLFVLGQTVGWLLFIVGDSVQQGRDNSAPLALLIAAHVVLTVALLEAWYHFSVKHREICGPFREFTQTGICEACRLPCLTCKCSCTVQCAVTVDIEEDKPRRTQCTQWLGALCSQMFAPAQRFCSNWKSNRVLGMSRVVFFIMVSLVLHSLYILLDSAGHHTSTSSSAPFVSNNARSQGTRLAGIVWCLLFLLLRAVRVAPASLSSAAEDDSGAFGDAFGGTNTDDGTAASGEFEMPVSRIAPTNVPQPEDIITDQPVAHAGDDAENNSAIQTRPPELQVQL